MPNPGPLRRTDLPTLRDPLLDYGVLSDPRMAPRWEAVAATAIQVAIVALVLFQPPLLGLADQGDFEREIALFGISFPRDLPEAQRYWSYIPREWEFQSARPSYARSSHMLLVGAAVLASKAAGADIFDIRYLGVIHLLVLAIVLYAVFRLFRAFPLSHRLLLYALSLLLFTDIGYVAYLQSFYFEPGTWLFGTALAAASVALAWRVGWWQAAAYCLAAALFLAAKRHNTPLVIPVAGLFLVLTYEAWSKYLRWRAAVAAGLGFFTLGAAYVFFSMPSHIRQRNAYQFVTMTLLPQSPDVDSVLIALGLGPRVKTAIGQHAFLPDTPLNDPESVPPSFTRSRVLWFLVQRPIRFAQVLESQVHLSLRNVLPHLGQFERDSGMPPVSQWPYFQWWDRIRHSLAHPAVWLLFLAAHAAAFALALWRRFGGNTSVANNLLLTQGVFGLMAVFSYISTVLGDGNDVQKHFFLPNFLFDACLVGAAAALANLRGISSHAKYFLSPSSSLVRA